MTKMWPSVYDPQKIEDSPGEKLFLIGFETISNVKIGTFSIVFSRRSPKSTGR